MGIWGQNPQQGPGAQPLVRGQGAFAPGPPEAKTILAFRRLIDAASLPTLFENAQVRYFCGFCQKMKFSRPQYATVYCELMKGNKNDARIT